MDTRKDIYNELNAISNTVANLPITNVYSISDNYLETLLWKVMGKINSKAYTVPEQYFEQLHQKVVARIMQEAADEQEELPEILKNIPKTNVYKVPQHYFDNEPAIKKSKVVEMPLKRKAKNWWRWAAAACLVGIVTSALYFVTKTTVSSNQVIEGTGGLTYQQIKNINIDKELEKISEKEVDNYLCEEGLLACADKPAADAIEKQIQDLEITDEELTQALEEL
jgi:hypothetical protein